jgi:xylan 1,4-beta-xylosidase
VHITEFNSSYRPDNPIHDTAFQAAYLAPVLAGGGEQADSFAYWTFSDMFEEAGVPTTLFHGGFGLLTHRQVKKPAFHLYSFMARMGDEVLARGEDYLVSRDGTGRVTVLAWAIEPHTVSLSIPCTAPAVPMPASRPPAVPSPASRPPAVFMLRRSVNDEQGNAWTAWSEMGRPASPSTRQLDALREAAEPARDHRRLPVVAGRVELDLTLARHEVTLVELTPVVDETPPWWDDTLGLQDG